jgi:hypothetical protein
VYDVAAERAYGAASRRCEAQSTSPDDRLFVTRWDRARHAQPAASAFPELTKTDIEPTVAGPTEAKQRGVLA